MIRRATLAALILFPAAFTFAQSAPPAAAAPQKLVIEKLSDKIHVIEGAGANVTVLSGPDGVLLIDSGDEANAPRVLEAVRSISDKPIRFVINTHWHPDHTGGNALLGAGATILAHDRTRRYLVLGGTMAGAGIPAASPAAIPNIAIQSETRIFINGETLQIFPITLGHTDGDIAVAFLDSNIVHTGDIFYSGRFPLIDTDSGASLSELIENLSALLQTRNEDVRFIAGHGPVAKLEDLRKFNAMIMDTANLVLGMIERGVTVDEIKKQKALEPWKAWAWDGVSADRYIELIVKASPDVRPRKPRDLKRLTPAEAPPPGMPKKP